MQLSFQICLGVLAALSTSANGLIFRDRITQDVQGTVSTLLHGAQGQDEVKFNVDAHGPKFNGWEFDTEGQPDTDAVIRPINSTATLVCKEGSICNLDLNGDEQQVFRLAKVNESTFSFQDTMSSLYVSRTADLSLELSDSVTDASYFTLNKITNSEKR
ncbi:hypothetical protein N7452_007234 [Penicillium brevicompactum]|uniref:Uncharacterized protein n=1 Tax=Penicillium brevicompactum TaxID=5074 RepID=A0A9W9QHG6_PENBR|nr:hypothetical protein N7452_007234 [Penicillium brevicompactum]